MMVRSVNGFSAGLAGGRPEDAAPHYLQSSRGERVIDSQASMAFGREIGRNKVRITVILFELVWVRLHNEWTTFAGRDERRIHVRILEELIHRAAYAFAVDWVAI